MDGLSRMSPDLWYFQDLTFIRKNTEALIELPRTERKNYNECSDPDSGRHLPPLDEGQHVLYPHLCHPVPGLPGGAPHVGEQGDRLTLDQGVVTRHRLRVTHIQTSAPDTCMVSRMRPEMQYFFVTS